MGDQQEEDYTSGPLQDRLEHKKWKGRQIAYLELQRVFEEAEDDDDPVFKNYGVYCSLQGNGCLECTVLNALD